MNKKLLHAAVFYCAVQLISSAAVFAASDTKSVVLTFYIEPVTAVRVESSFGSGKVELGTAVPGVELPPQSLNVSVFSNEEQPYQIYHEMQHEMAAANGAPLAGDFFRFLVAEGTRGGRSSVSSWTAVPQGRIAIFSSNGGGDQFFVHYAVSGSDVLEAGDYYGHMRLVLEKN